MADQSAFSLLVQQLQQELQNQRTDMQSLRSELSDSRSQIHSLRSEVNELRGFQLNSSSRSPRFSLPDPPKFDGKPSTLRTWLPSIRAKLRSDSLEGPVAFDYIWDRLEQPQQASILHLRDSAENSYIWDPETIFSFFQRLCHNPREKQEAIQRFSIVRQREEESLIAYLARFERLTYEADATSWPDTSRITTLHRGLRPNLRRTLEDSSDSLFTLGYNDYIELVQSIDRRIRQPQPQPQPQPRKPVSPAPRSDPMDISLARPRSPVYIGAARPRSRPETPDSAASRSQIRQNRLDNGSCLYCGSFTHTKYSCPNGSRFSSISGSPRRSPRTKTTAKSEVLSGRRPPSP
jgi:hypothetical protein